MLVLVDGVDLLLICRCCCCLSFAAEGGWAFFGLKIFGVGKNVSQVAESETFGLNPVSLLPQTFIFGHVCPKIPLRISDPEIESGYLHP